MRIEVRVDVHKLKEMLQTTPAEVAYYVHDGVEYGIYQELGTRRMPAQPFIRPAVERAGRALPELLAQHGLERLDGAVREAALQAVAQAKALAPVRTGALRNSISLSKERPG